MQCRRHRHRAFAIEGLRESLRTFRARKGLEASHGSQHEYRFLLKIRNTHFGIEKKEMLCNIFNFSDFLQDHCENWALKKSIKSKKIAQRSFFRTFCKLKKKENRLWKMVRSKKITSKSIFGTSLRILKRKFGLWLKVKKMLQNNLSGFLKLQFEGQDKISRM